MTKDETIFHFIPVTCLGNTFSISGLESDSGETTDYTLKKQNHFCMTHRDCGQLLFVTFV